MLAPGKTLDSCRSYLESHLIKLTDKTYTLKKRSVSPFITISRETGSGNTQICKLLLQYLNDIDNKKRSKWTLFDKDVLTDFLNDEYLTEKLNKFLPEEYYTESEELIEEFLGMHPTKREKVYKLSRFITDLSEMGNCIIIGRGSNIITAGKPNGLNVRFIGSYKKRISYIQKNLSLSKKDAEAYVRKEDRNRKAYVKKIFGKDIDDPLLYDLVINTDQISYENAAMIISDQVLRLYE